MQFPGQMRPPMGIGFDADFGSDLDGILALCLLWMLDNKNECRAISFSTSANNLHSAALFESFQKIYGGRPSAIGMRTNVAMSPDASLLGAAIENQNVTVKSVLDTAEPHGLIRNMLAAQHDGNATLICAGPTGNLEDLLKLPTALPVIKAKVSKLYLVGKDPQPIAGWPTPTVLVPTALAKDLKWMPKAEDFSWNETHPALQAIKANAGAPIHHATMLAVLLAVRGKDFQLPLTAEMSAAADKVFAEVTTVKPAPRQQFRRPPV